uniref:Uncharacterized protein n=1 Tax=viral metagenome TaxID=1070528 RepID=A0A6C0EG22_9ZZZZ
MFGFVQICLIQKRFKALQRTFFVIFNFSANRNHFNGTFVLYLYAFPHFSEKNFNLFLVYVKKN